MSSKDNLKSKKDDLKPAVGSDAGAEGQPRMQMLSQYVKDLSFENPGMSYGAQPGKMELALNVDIQASRVAENSTYEVVLKLRATAKDAEKPLFLIELSYAGLFLFENVPQDSLQAITLVECPRLLFPFARRVIADVVRDGGLPPLMLDPIDFLGLYQQRVAQGNQAPVATA